MVNTKKVAFDQKVVTFFFFPKNAHVNKCIDLCESSLWKLLWNFGRILCSSSICSLSVWSSSINNLKCFKSNMLQELMDNAPGAYSKYAPGVEYFQIIHNFWAKIPQKHRETFPFSLALSPCPYFFFSNQFRFVGSWITS